MKIISGHQPVYLPWPGLFHKLSLADVFVYMDTVQYVEKDWNNRNKIRTPQGSIWLTVPVDRKRSKGRNLNEIIPRGFENPADRNFWQREHWRSICSNYFKARFFETYAEELREFYEDHVWSSLVELCWEQFQMFRRWLGLSEIPVVRMSEMTFEGAKDELVLNHARKLEADAVVFGSHGKDYVRPEIFQREGVKVYFQNYQFPKYPQRFSGFEAYLSVLDLFCNCGPDAHEILMKQNLSKHDLLVGGHWDIE